MRATKAEKFKYFLVQLRWFALIAVIVLLISMGVLVLVGLYELFLIISHSLDKMGNGYALDTDPVAARLLGIVDIYLLAVVMYIFAIAIYKLFIGNFIAYKWLIIEDMDHLKSHLVKMILLFLATFAIKKIVEWDGSMQILYFSISISIVGAMLVWFSISLKHDGENGYPRNGKKKELE